MEVVVERDPMVKVREVFDLQRQSSIKFRTEPVSNRKKRLKNLYKWISIHQEEIRDALYKDFQKPHRETDLSETYVALSEIRVALSNLNKWAKPKKMDTSITMITSKASIQYEPKGICLILGPFNFPFNLVLGPLVSAIAAGNTVIMKPSEMTSNTSRLLKKMVEDTFSEEEVFVVEGGVEISTALLEMPFNHIFFTGSPRVGKIVMAAAAKNLASVTLELGGKSPVFVDESANIKDAAWKLVTGKYSNTGQTCVAPDYIVVHEKKKEELITELKKSITKFYDKGNGIKESDTFARIINDAHYDRLENILEDAVKLGAKIEEGGETDRGQRYISPTIISGVSDEMRIMKEEIFGPLLPITTYSDLDKEIEKVNQMEKPLALYLFSRNRKNKNKVLQSTSSGTACINDCVIQFLHQNLPFGGVNNSGIGKSHGYHGFLAFSNEKAVLRQNIGFTMTRFVIPPHNSFKDFVSKLMVKYF